MSQNTQGQHVNSVNRHTLINLSQKPRANETVIRYFLMLCGILSIFTTFGIIVVLGQESFAFFNRQLWENTNRGIAEAIDETQTVFALRSGGGDLPHEGFIRLGEEILEIVRYDENAIQTDVVGTGGGFTRFCAGQADINDASRTINADELAACQANGIDPIGFRIGTDALAIVVNANNDFVQDVTLEELRQIFGTAETWADVRPEWPNTEIIRYIPGTDSGTFDYFVNAVFGETPSPLLTPDANTNRISSANVITSEDDNQLVRGIGENEYSIGFFGYAYYLENQDKLNIVSVEGVAPSAETVDDATYPLARPLFVYTSENILREKPQVAAFVEYYLTDMNDVLAGAGYFPASTEAQAETQQAWLDTTGKPLTAEPEIDLITINGDVVITGSSTVAPVTSLVEGIFREAGYLPQIEVIRGAQGTTPAAHEVDTPVEVGDRVSLVEFFTNTVWQPAIREFGILPLVYGTLATSIIAMLVALPLGLGAAIYLSEYAPARVRSTLKPVLEILAGIPTVVYGYFALTFMTPLLRGILGAGTVEIYNSASAGVVVGILIIPLISSMSEDALSAVPRSLREASYGLGATKLETTMKVVIPAALSGLLAAFIIAISRAIGETMVVAIAAGAGPQNDIPGLLRTRGLGIIFQPAETMTGHMARISGGDLSYDSIDYNSIFAIGLMLFIITMILNIISRLIISRFRERY